MTSLQALRHDGIGRRVSLFQIQYQGLDLATGRTGGALFTDEIRCPVAVQDLASALLELVGGDAAGVLNVAGPEAVSRHELGVLVDAFNRMLDRIQTREEELSRANEELRREIAERMGLAPRLHEEGYRFREAREVSGSGRRIAHFDPLRPRQQAQRTVSERAAVALADRHRGVEQP